MRFKDLIFRLAVTVVPLLATLASCTREEGELWAETECSLQADASIIATRAGGHAVPAAETLSGVEADRVSYSYINLSPVTGFLCLRLGARHRCPAVRPALLCVW